MKSQAIGARRFGRVNWLGLQTLAERELRRFLAIWMQTVLAPVVTAGLFMLIFSIAIGPSRQDVMGVPFATFLAPGLMMMTIVQSAFANTSSSLMVAKVQGNIVDTLMPPLSGTELTIGYLAGGVGRGLCVAFAIAIGAAVFLGITPLHPFMALGFAVLGAALMGALGLIAAIWAGKFDQMAAITNFVITPLAFLSGTFYSVSALPPVLRAASHFNPLFYLIDGMRYAVTGVSDSSPVLGVCVCGVSAAIAIGVVRWMLGTGYRLKS